MENKHKFKNYLKSRPDKELAKIGLSILHAGLLSLRTMAYHWPESLAKEESQITSDALHNLPQFIARAEELSLDEGYYNKENFIFEIEMAARNLVCLYNQDRGIFLEHLDFYHEWKEKGLFDELGMQSQPRY